MIELKTKINFHKVFISFIEMRHFDTVIELSIGNNSGRFVTLCLMLETVSRTSSFEFCKKTATYLEWLDVYKEIKKL